MSMRDTCTIFGAGAAAAAAVPALVVVPVESFVIFDVVC